MISDHRRGFEHGVSGEKVIPNRSECIEVASRIGALRHGQRLGRHVERRPRQHARPWHRRFEIVRLEWLDEPEVHHLRNVGFTPSLGQNDIRGLDVAVYEASTMRLHQRPTHLIENRDHAARRLGPVHAHEVLEIDAVEILHGVVKDADQLGPDPASSNLVKPLNDLLVDPRRKPLMPPQPTRVEFRP